MTYPSPVGHLKSCKKGKLEGTALRMKWPFVGCAVMLFHKEHGNGSQSQLWAQILQQLCDLLYFT